MEGSRTRTDGSSVGGADDLAEFLLEGIYMGTDWGDPVGVKGFFDKFEFGVAHVWGREKDWFGHIPLV